jgi:hypothetical protein
MARTDGNHTSSRKSWLVLAGVLVTVIAVWLLVTGRSHISRLGEVSSIQNGLGKSQSRSDNPDGSATESPGITTSRKRPGDAAISEGGEDGLQFPLVDEILSDGEISNEVAAARLREIVGNKDLAALEREEALAHGLNLDFNQFIDLVADPQLPQPLARRFFDEMLNYNERRDLQVRSCISLIDHEDKALRGEAAEQLAFYIGLEEWADNPEVLKQEAYAFLDKLAKRVPSEPEPANPDADIPETAPINPLETDEEEPTDG